MSGHATGQLRGRVAANLVAAMAAEDVSTVELAHTLGISERGIRRWRSGKIAPNETNLHLIAETLKVEDASWFYLDHGDELKAAA